MNARPVTVPQELRYRRWRLIPRHRTAPMGTPRLSVIHAAKSNLTLLLASLVLGMLLGGCGGSSVDSGLQDLAGRASLNAEELDALTAAGEGSEAVEFNAVGADGGHQPFSSTFRDASGALPSNRLEMPSRPSMALPSVRQSNSIRQSW